MTNAVLDSASQPKVVPAKCRECGLPTTAPSAKKAKVAICEYCEAYLADLERYA